MTANERVAEIVRRVILDWNPYGLVPSDSPSDTEFDSEIKAVVKGLGRVQSARDASLLLSRVFASSFGDPRRFSVEACVEPGAKLWTALTTDQENGS